MSLADKILSYHFNLKPTVQLPEQIQWLNPFNDEEVKRCMTLFYKRYYGDQNRRIFILGINPGRFGAGITGIPFTDPIRLISLSIENAFQKRQELSSVFIYDMIKHCGGPDWFFSKYYIASLSPLGFTRHGRNYNYYDDRDLAEAVKPFIISNIETQLQFGADPDKVFCLGQGKNYNFLLRLNKEHRWWKEIIPLPHPRWIMQYQLPQKAKFLSMYYKYLSKRSEDTSEG